MMRVLGIDPGSETTGWGVVEGDARKYQALGFGALKAAPKLSFAARLLIINTGVEELIRKYQPDALSLEEAFYATNVKVALKLGQVRGVILLAGARAQLDINEYAPRLVKQTVVGYGAAEKQQVGEMVRVLLKLPEVPAPHDVSDALAIAICHFHHAGMKQRIIAADARITRSLALRTSSKRMKSKDEG